MNWISCTYKLPPHGVECLLFHPNKIGVGQLLVDPNTEHDTWEFSELHDEIVYILDFSSVTDWCPLNTPVPETVTDIGF